MKNKDHADNSLNGASSKGLGHNLGKGQKLYEHAKTIIPGGTQLFSKRPELFAPDLWPSYYSHAKGSYVWDLDENRFLDMSLMSVGACILGYADDDVDEAVIESIKKGVNTTLNCPEEVQLAEMMLDLHPWFDMVRYSKSGGEAVSIAIRIARAATKKEIVLFSGYHGWSDWYLSANLASDNALDGQLMPGLQPNGIPRGLMGTAESFEFNNIDSLKAKIIGNENNIAAIMIEPARGELASDNFLTELRQIADDLNAVLIFDEITSGFRMCAGGVHREFKEKPDMAVFAKSLANGYPMSVIIGKSSVMEAAQSTFISSTNWTERTGLAAAIATITKYQKLNVHQHIKRIGESVKQIWESEAEKHSLNISTSGLPAIAGFTFNHENAQALQSAFTIEMLSRGILGFKQFRPSLAHTEKEVEIYRKAVDEVFLYLTSLNELDISNINLADSTFRKLTKE
jgi:glutamate-1-semialdehyde aminotransferase